MKALVLMNAYPNGEKFYHQSERIAQELRALGVQTDVVKNGELSFVVDKNGELIFQNADGYDFAVYLDKDKYVGKALESQGIRLFNGASQVEICDDKMLTYLALSGQNIPLAQTIPAPLCYTPNVVPNENFLRLVEKELGFPMVVKSSYGSLGKGVHLVHGRGELLEISQKLLYQPHFYQRYIQSSCGQDIRVIVIGGKALGGMQRVAKAGEFRSNVELGGVGRAVDLSPEYIRLAETVATILRLDYCGIDLLRGEDGPIVCEVNSNAFFQGFEETTGINVAKAYAKYMVNQMQK